MEPRSLENNQTEPINSDRDDPAGDSLDAADQRLWLSGHFPAQWQSRVSEPGGVHFSALARYDSDRRECCPCDVRINRLSRFP